MCVCVYVCVCVCMCVCVCVFALEHCLVSRNIRSFIKTIPSACGQGKQEARRGGCEVVSWSPVTVCCGVIKEWSNEVE